jgi:hypothetical protein
VSRYGLVEFIRRDVDIDEVHFYERSEKVEIYLKFFEKLGATSSRDKLNREKWEWKIPAILKKSKCTNTKETSMSDSHSHPAYAEGFDSFRKNKGDYVNPYTLGTVEHNAFERGWIQRLKRMPDSQVRAINQRANRDKQSYKEEREKKRKDLEIQKAKEEYLKGKGR